MATWAGKPTEREFMRDAFHFEESEHVCRVRPQRLETSELLPKIRKVYLLRCGWGTFERTEIKAFLILDLDNENNKL